MKKILLFGFVMTLLFLFSVTAEAADPAKNRKLGYFNATRTVLLLPARYQSDDGNYAALCLYGKLEEIFRYPYYRRLDNKNTRQKISDRKSWVKYNQNQGRTSWFCLL